MDILDEEKKFSMLINEIRLQIPVKITQEWQKIVDVISGVVNE